MDITEIRARRRQINIPPEILELLIDLPEGCRVFAIRGAVEPFGIAVTVVDEAFEPVPPHSEAPFLQSSVSYDEESGRIALRYDVEGARS